jgi:hypothetical protein
MRKTVKLRSGLTGSQEKLQDRYVTLSSFRRYSEIYGIHLRLGYKTVESAWKKNPTIQSGVNGNDLCKVDRTGRRRFAKLT